MMRRHDDDGAGTDYALVRPVGERRLAIEDEEELGIRMLVERRAFARLSIDEDHTCRNAAEVVADELAGEVARRQIGLGEEGDSHVSRTSSFTRPARGEPAAALIAASTPAAPATAEPSAFPSAAVAASHAELSAESDNPL